MFKEGCLILYAKLGYIRVFKSNIKYTTFDNRHEVRAKKGLFIEEKGVIRY